MLGPVLLGAGIILVASGVGAFLLPFRSGRVRLTIADLSLGLSAGLAIQVVLLTWTFDRLGPITFSLSLIVGALGWLFGLGWCRWRGLTLRWRTDPRIAAGWFALVLLVTLAVLLHPAPRGHDPVFHSILIRKLLEDGRLARDWTPFEPVAVIYPQGSHLLLAMLSQLSGLEPPTVFQASFAWAGILELLLLGTVARAFVPTAGYRLTAVALHTAATRFGSPLHVQLWGGLPTLIGSSFLLAIVAGLTAPRQRPLPTGAAIGLHLAALLAVHHLTALIAGWLLVLWFVPACVGDSAISRSRRRTLGVAALAAFGLALPSLIGYSAKFDQIGQTHTLRYTDEPCYFGPLLAESLGWTLIPWSLLGLIQLATRRATVRRTPDLLLWTLGLALAYLILDVGYRRVAESVWGQSLTAFTPSRWLSALTTPLSLIAAIPLARPLYPPLRNLLRLLLAATIALGLTVTLRDVWTTRSRASDDLLLYRWIRSATPPNAFLIFDVADRIAGNPWMPYQTGRESFASPLPASEPRDAPAVRIKRDLFQQTRQTGDQTPLRAWLDQTGRTGILVVGPDRLDGPLPPSLRPIGSFQGVTLLRIEPISPNRTP
ncbi:MAG: hypothetical protein KatS3mg108_1421 [Isosphaeraceae bacterium]|jgi:hypothetical protein|nr:MAG: hypothetical protein KatS3mg108_1421 [Isosphaeraceae bacterium]